MISHEAGLSWQTLLLPLVLSKVIHTAAIGQMTAFVWEPSRGGIVHKGFTYKSSTSARMAIWATPSPHLRGFSCQVQASLPGN